MDTIEIEACTSSTLNSCDSDLDEMNWRFSEIKGHMESEEARQGDGEPYFDRASDNSQNIIDEADVISCVAFSHDGEFLATGDKGGRVVIFQRDQSGKFINGKRSTDYNVYSTFQSHEPEFDYLKSLEIEEKINQIKWLKKKNAANFLLSTNDKTVKLWKISEREKKVADGGWNIRRSDNGESLGYGFAGSLILPQLIPMELIVEASARRVYGNAHTYHINSISVNSDQDIFLSADDLRINLWHLEVNNESFNIVDIKPSNMEELTEVITAAEFHPRFGHFLAYSSSKGSIRLCDMRDRALCDSYAKIFEETEGPSSCSFFSEIIASVSDVKFSNSGRYILTRDYFSAKVWDINMESGPVETYPVHEHLRGKLCNLYEGDYIFDKFGVEWSGDDRYILTGSYNNHFRTFPRNGGNPMKSRIFEARIENRGARLPHKRFTSMSNLRCKNGYEGDVGIGSLDFSKKILHAVWHPKQDIIAMAATNRLFIFQDH